MATWTTLPEPLLRAALAGADRRDGALVFELHAIDLLDEHDAPALASIADAQRDLRVPAREKLRRLGALFRRLGGERRLATLAELAS